MWAQVSTTLHLLDEPMDKSFADVSTKCFQMQCASLYLSSIESNLFRHALEVRMSAEKGTKCNIDEKRGSFYIQSLRLSICHEICFGSASTTLYNNVATVSDIVILKVVIKIGLRSDASVLTNLVSQELRNSDTMGLKVGKGQID